MNAILDAMHLGWLRGYRSKICGAILSLGSALPLIDAGWNGGKCAWLTPEQYLYWAGIMAGGAAWFLADKIDNMRQGR